jgi:hypothetical protein
MVNGLRVSSPRASVDFRQRCSFAFVDRAGRPDGSRGLCPRRRSVLVPESRGAFARVSAAFSRRRRLEGRRPFSPGGRPIGLALGRIAFQARADRRSHHSSRATSRRRWRRSGEAGTTPTYAAASALFLRLRPRYPPRSSRSGSRIGLVGARGILPGGPEWVRERRRGYWLVSGWRAARPALPVRGASGGGPRRGAPPAWARSRQPSLSISGQLFLESSGTSC